MLRCCGVRCGTRPWKRFVLLAIDLLFWPLVRLPAFNLSCNCAVCSVLSVQASKLFSENDMEGMFALLTPLHQQMSVVRFHFPFCQFSPIAGP